MSHGLTFSVLIYIIYMYIYINIKDALKSSISAHQRNLFRALLQTGICTFDKPEHLEAYCHHIGGEICEKLKEDTDNIKDDRKRRRKNRRKLSQGDEDNVDERGQEGEEEMHLSMVSDVMKDNSTTGFFSKANYWNTQNISHRTHRKRSGTDGELGDRRNNNHNMKKRRRRLTPTASLFTHHHSAHEPQSKQPSSPSSNSRTIFIASDSLDVKQGLHLLHHNPKKGVPFVLILMKRLFVFICVLCYL
jgi:hypothetical protein